MANPLPNYEDLGFNKFLQRSIRSVQTSQAPSSDLNFDQVQTSGSLGSVIQVGDINIDGVNRRVEIRENGELVVLLGKDYE